MTMRINIPWRSFRTGFYMGFIIVMSWISILFIIWSIVDNTMTLVTASNTCLDQYGVGADFFVLEKCMEMEVHRLSL